MDRVVAKLKFQAEVLAGTKKPIQEKESDSNFNESDEFIENFGKPNLSNDFEVEDFNKSFIDPLLLDQPIFPGAMIANSFLFSQAEKFVATMRIDLRAERALKMLEFVKSDNDFEFINERVRPSAHTQDFYKSYVKLGTDQRQAFNIVASHLLEQQCVKN